ncbi:MAG: hypothetical protein PHQ36_14670 [Anaerolineales bacterium]|nr:hypothetical protein [Anaerolineales bacterium]
MPTLSNRKELFRAATTKDKLTLFHLLFDSQLLDMDLSLALLNLIHKELSADKERDRSLYKHYAESIETLRYYMSDVLQLVVEGWQQNRKRHDNP